MVAQGPDDAATAAIGEHAHVAGVQPGVANNVDTVVSDSSSK